MKVYWFSVAPDGTSVMRCDSLEDARRAAAHLGDIVLGITWFSKNLDDIMSMITPSQV